MVRQAVSIVLALSLLLGAQSAGAQTITLPDEAVSRKTLDNGLTVFAKRSAPDSLVAIDVKIRAGSANEGEYLGSGISHVVEHMVFKGTKLRGPGEIEKEIKSYGGIMNGSAGTDVTEFHVVVPSNYLSQALAVIKDMLTNAVFDPAELAKEKDVVLKEIRLRKDDPQSEMLRLLNQTAYLSHPYKHPVIGYEQQVSALTRDDIVKYYMTMYVPNRMVVAIVGGVDPEAALIKAEAAFRDLKKPNFAPSPTYTEPAQIETRRAADTKEISLAYLGIGFHSTSINSKDLYAADVLAMILGRGDNSRLNTSLVKTKRLAHSVAAWNYTPKDPGLFVITAILDNDKLDAAESAITYEVDRIRAGNIDYREIEGARRMVLADFISILQTVDGQANDIALSYLLTGSSDFSKRYVEGIQAVTKDDVIAAANTYLNPKNMTVVTIAPKGPGVSAAKAQPESRDEITKTVLPNGIRILVRENHKVPTVSMTAVMLGGIMVETPSKNGLSSFTANMLLRGTSTRSESQIRGLIEEMGGSMEAFSGFNALGVTIEVLKTDLDRALDIMKDVVANPSFPQDEIDKEKSLTLAALSEENDDIFASGINKLRKALFVGSPYALRYLGEPATIAALRREDIVAFHATYCVPNNIVIAVSGDVDTATLVRKVTEAFSILAPKTLPTLGVKGTRLSESKIVAAEMDKEQSLVLIGYETTTTRDNDRYALDVLSSVLSGQSGRLFNQMRNRDALAYTLGCTQKLGLDTGYFALYVATTKDKIPAAEKGLFEEVKTVRQSAVSDEELLLAKRELVSARQVAAQTNGFYSLTSALDELYGLGYDNVYAYTAEIEKVTAEDVQRVARKYFNPDAYAEIIISSR